MQNAGYIFAAYTIIWAVLLGYVLVMTARQKKLRRETEALRETLKLEVLRTNSSGPFVSSRR